MASSTLLLLVLYIHYHMAVSDYSLVLYAHGLFETPSLSTQTVEIATSGFQTIILWTLHIDPTDITSLKYNDHIIVSNGSLNESYYGQNGINIKSKIALLKTNGVQTVLFGIGSGPPPQDFTLIANIYKNPLLKQVLFNNFKVLLDLGIDGFDYDCEEFNGDTQPLVDVIVDMVNQFQIMGATVQTFVPYDDIDEWIECLQQIYENNNKQLINWWNVQCYSGGENNRYDLQSVWVDEISKQSESIGVYNATGFIVSGCDGKLGAYDIENEFKEYASGIVDGGFLWVWPDQMTTQNLSVYKTAIVDGLNGI